MAENLEDPAFWLPSDFLGDDFFLDGGEKNSSLEGGAFAADTSFPGELPYGFDFNRASPVDSTTGSESDEEDYMAGLAQKMAHSFLQDDDKGSSVLSGHGSKMHVMAGSPKSTLSPWLASERIPNGASQVSSPPSSPFEGRRGNPWDMLYQTAGQVMLLHSNDQGVRGRGLLRPPTKPSARISAPSKKPNPNASANAGYYHTPLFTQQQLQEAQFYHLQKQQLRKQQQLSADRGVGQGRARVGSGGGGGGYGGEGRCGGPALGVPSSAWPPLQKQQQQQQPPPQQRLPGSGMRAVFLTGPGARRESAGTGVFLPRRVGTSYESRKKPACSTVLLPARVVQALNLNLKELGAQQRYTGGFVLNQEAQVSRTNATLSHQKRNHLRPQPAAVASHDIRLPQEWTY